MRYYLRVFREKKQLSQQIVADKLGMSQQGYALIENGTRQKNISLPLLERLAEVFGVPLDVLVQAERDYKKAG